MTLSFTYGVYSGTITTDAGLVGANYYSCKEAICKYLCVDVNVQGEMKEKLAKLMQGDLTLVSTHEKLCFPIIERIAKKMAIGISFASISVDRNVIINGHHRYLASLLIGYDLHQIPCPKTNAKKEVDWKSVKLVDEDWDTEAKIRMLNEADARYNDLTLDELMEKLQ